MVDTNEGWRSRIVGHDSVPPSELTANPRNWRKHPKAQQQALADVLDRVGWVQDVIVNQRTGLLVDGHARLELALRRGEDSVPVVYVDLEPDEEALVLATLDPLSAMAEADDEALRALMADVVADGAIAGMLAELTGANEPKAGKTDPDDVPNLDGVAIYVNRGDIYRLGDHRLMCGDSTSADVVRIMDGRRASCMWTDPPYGVSYVGKTKKAMTIENDGADGLRELLAGAFSRASEALEPGAPFYIARPAVAQSLTFGDAVREAGWHLHQELQWVKDSMVLGHSDYHLKHETIMYGWTPGPGRSGRGNHDGSRWHGNNAQVSVFEVPRPKRSDEHPTAKPVALVEAMLENSTQLGSLLWEPFLGSGTTLIAAERLGRRCYGMEIDPKYAQVAIERWEQFTGKKAEKVDAPQLEA